MTDPLSRPRIVVTLDQGQALRRGVPFPMVELKAAYAEAITQAGGLPLLVAPTDEPGVVAELVALADGLVVTGGAFDIDPVLYGAAVPAGTRVDPPKPLRTRFEWALLEGALARGRPVLGVCGGMQLLNVVLGGTLRLDIAAEVPGALEHEQATSPAEPAHPVQLRAGSALARALGRERIEVNTTHHQAIAQVAAALEVVGTSPDGVIELVVHRERPAVVGVQWHPELLDDDASRALYGAHVRAAAE